MIVPEMPWRLEMRPRTGNEDQAVVIFRNGITRLATIAEKKIWDYVQSLEEKLAKATSLNP